MNTITNNKDTLCEKCTTNYYSNSPTGIIENRWRRKDKPWLIERMYCLCEIGEQKEMQHKLLMTISNDPTKLPSILFNPNRGK